jgi:tape measure domain-containing protein
MMMADNPKVTVEIEAKGTQQAKAQTNDFKKALDALVSTASAMNISLQKIAEQTRKVDTVTSGASNSAKVLNTSLTALGTGGASKSNTELGKLNTTTAQAKAKFDDYKKTLDSLVVSGNLTNLRLQQIAEQTKKVENGVRGAKRETSQFAGAMGNLKNAVLAYISINTVKQLADTADKMRMLEARTINASKSIALGTRNFEALKKVAVTTGISLEGIVTVFQRISNTKNSIGATNAEMLTLTDTVSKIGILSGASGEAIKNSLMQFSQAMASGIVRAEEFNSMQENTQELVVKIAEGLGVSTGKLRNMVIEGKLLSKDVFDVKSLTKCL